MYLTLTIASTNHPGLLEPSFRFDQAGGTIGRDQSCSWVLPDAHQLLSGQHIRVDLDGDSFIISDTSRNGVFINGAVQPLGRDRRHVVANSDQIQISDYQLIASIEGGASQPSWLSRAQSHVRTVADDLMDSAPGRSAALDPLAQIGAAPTRRVEMPRPIRGHAPADELSDLFEDPSAFGEASLTAPETRAPDPLAAIPRDGFASPALPVHVAVQPAPAAPPIQAIPEDWLSGALGDVQLPPPRPPREMPRPAVPVSDPVALLAQRQAARDRPDALPAGTRPSGAPHADAALLASLWNALQIDPGTISHEQKLAFIAELGRATRATAEGLIQVLSMRASTKSEFELEQTMVRATENNLFKFASNADELLMLAMGNKNRMFMPIDRAIAGSFADIKANEVATIAAVQLSIRSLIDRFQPQKLAAQVKAREGRQLFGSFKASCWDFFSEIYSNLAADADEASSQIFTAEFGRAYRERLAAIQSLPVQPRDNEP